MEARGFGRSGATRAPRTAWTLIDRTALVGAVVLVGVAVAWL
jgi:energy-coupling factor transporter transmembrane protein EcfT